MKKIKKNKASALLVAIGLLAVLSAMAFTFATVVKVEMQASNATDTMTQTEMLDNWAVQSIIDKLKNEPGEGAMYTPVDWAGEAWYTRPLINNSPALPLGSTMTFATQFPGKGIYTIDARVIDCSSQINVAAADLKDQESVDRLTRLLSHIPFGIRYEWPTAETQYYPIGGVVNELGSDLASSLIDCIRKITDRGELLTKESLLQEVMQSRAFQNAVPSVAGMDSVEERVALYYLGKKDQAGNVLTVGLKDFLTFDSWVDNRVLNSSMDKVLPRAPININTAPYWTLLGVFDGIRSNETVVSPDDARSLARYIVAYRTPSKYLDSNYRQLQKNLGNWINELRQAVPSTNDVAFDPKNKDDLREHLLRLSPLLINPPEDELKDQLKDAGKPNLFPTDGYEQLPRPFSSWTQFDAFLKLLVYEGQIGGGDVATGRAIARAVMANCNPNTNYNGTGDSTSAFPARNSFAPWNCGKNHILAGTTELCFGSFGRFEMEMIVGQTRTVHGSLSENVRLGTNNFIDEYRFQDGTVPNDDDKFRTIKQGIFAPDRVCFYNGNHELIAMRAILDKSGKTLRFAIPMNTDLAENIAYWTVERMESVKKWSTTVKFADAIRLTHEADFIATDETSGEGIGGTLFPEAMNKKVSANSPSTFDVAAHSLERDGSIGMRTDAPQATGHLTDTFSGGQTKGIVGPGSIYNGGVITSTGAWLAKSNSGSAPLRYNFYDFFPREPQKAQKGPVNTLEFTASMWFSPTTENFSGKILSCVVKGDFRTTVDFSINANKELELTLEGAVETVSPKGGAAKPKPYAIKFEGTSAIDVSSWKPGKWYWIGFGYQGKDPQDQSQARLFATTLTDDNVAEVVVRERKTKADMQLQLYRGVQRSFVDFGEIDGVVDDIIVRDSFEGDPKQIMPEHRFLSTSYTSPEITLNRYVIADKKDYDKVADAAVTYGTIAWTEHLTPNTFPKGDEFSDVYVKVQRSDGQLGSTAGKLTTTANEFKPLGQIPVWLDHDALIANWAKFVRIGMTGDGQRICGEGGSWSGYDADGEVVENETGTFDDKINIIIEIKGPGDSVDTQETKQTENFETPYVDDVTLTIFPPYDIMYWKQATETYE